MEDLVKDEQEDLDLDAWQPQLPTGGFADRVLERIRTEATPQVASITNRRRRWGVAAAAATTLALAAAIALKVSAPPSSGEAIAQDRIEVRMGSRALAVLESGASVRWSRDDVVQSRGDVFYRVEPGARFTVHTPAGDVEVKGTCFGVKVRSKEGSEEVMQKRDVKSGFIGGALTALAFVTVYEGRVAVSHASERADLSAGEAAQIGPDGVRRAADAAKGEKAFQESAAAQTDEPLTNANQRLAHQVGEYRSRLEAILAQKSELEEKLKRSEATLAATQDGSATPSKHPYDLSQDDWKQMAAEGTLKFQLPCLKRGKAWSPNAENLNALGLSPQDGATISNAFAHSNERVAAAVKPYCVKLVGNPEVVDKLGVETCMFLVLDTEDKGTAMHDVAEMRAGMRPMPKPEGADPATKILLLATSENKALEEELTQSFGPDEAHRIVFSDEMCMNRSTFRNGNGKKPTTPPMP
jgi:hypothetical protein